MKTKSISLLSASIFTLVLFMSFASAALTLTEVSVSSPVEHNSEITLTFTLEADANYTTLDWSNNVAPSKGTWTSLPTITSINNGDNLSLTAILMIDQYANGDIIDAIIDVEDTNTLDIDSLTFNTITIADSPSLSVSDLTISQGSDSGTITVINDGNEALTGIDLTQSGSDFTVSFNPNTSFNLDAGKDKDVTVTITSVLEDLELGPNSVTVTATADDGTTDSGTVSTTGSFCEYSNPGKLDVTIDKINVEEGFGDDEDYWYLFDEIEIEVDVEVDGSWDIDNIEVEWKLYTTDGKKIMKGDESDFNLDYDEDETITITFKLDEDVEDFEREDAIFYVKAIGKIDDSDAGSYDNEDTCDWASEKVEVKTSDDFVILDDINIQEVTISPGSELHITADVWNIGDDEQDDVMILISEGILGISKRIIIGEVQEFDSENLETTIKIPSDAKEGTYYLEFRVYDDDEIYENDEDDKSIFKIQIRVEGPPIEGVGEADVDVYASLESGGQAGEELVVKATITNTGDGLESYGLGASGYSDWASLLDITPKTIVLNPGDSKEILFTFEVDKDASGEKFFDIEITSAQGEVLVTQPASVIIEKSRGFAGITGGVIGGDNWYLWGIGLLNIILVIIIIIVAVRLARR